MKKFVKLIFTLMVAYPLIGIVISSCAGESDCSTAGRPMLNAEVRTIVNNVAVNDTLDFLRVTALGTDSVIINNQSNVHLLSLPLRYTSDTTILVFHYTESDHVRNKDTVTIWHTNNPKFISMDCGYEMKQAVLRIAHTKDRLDSIRVTNTSTNTDGTKNLELFYR